MTNTGSFIFNSFCAQLMFADMALGRQVLLMRHGHCRSCCTGDPTLVGELEPEDRHLASWHFLPELTGLELVSEVLILGGLQ